MANKPVIIAFSGGCFSGKTTTMEALKKELEKRGHRVVMLDELVRNKKIKSIDDIRKNPNKYVNFQNDVIGKKIKAEMESMKLDCDVVLIDRAITDSLFYLTFYVDKAHLSDEAYKKYSKLIKKTINHVSFAFEHIYDAIVEFKPIDDTCNDAIYRPERIDTAKFIEHKMISMLNESQNKFNCFDIIYADLNTHTLDFTVSRIISDQYL